MEDDIIESTDLVYPIIPNLVPRDNVVLGQKRRPSWAHQSLQDAEGHDVPRPFWERKRL